MSERIPAAAEHPKGFFEARPGDVAGRSDVIWVDVRPREDLLGDWGHIHGVTSLPGQEIVNSEVQPNTPVVLLCENGRASRKVATLLVESHGFTEVYHLVGGMVRWNAEERPVAKTRTWK